MKVHKNRAKLSEDANQQKKVEHQRLEIKRLEWRENSKHHQKLEHQQTWADDREKKVKSQLRHVKAVALGRSEERMIQQLNAVRRGPGRGTFAIAEVLPAKPLHAQLAPMWSETVTETQAKEAEKKEQAPDAWADVRHELSLKEPDELERERELRVLVATILSGPWEGFSRAKDAAESDPVALWSDCNLSFCAPKASTSDKGKPRSVEKEMLGRVFGFSKCEDPVLGQSIARSQMLGVGSEEPYERERRLTANLDGVLDFSSNRVVVQARQGKNEQYFSGGLVWEGDQPEDVNGADGRPLALTALAEHAVAQAAAVAANVKAQRSTSSSQHRPDGISTDSDSANNDHGGIFGVFPSGAVQNFLTRMLNDVVMCVETDGIALQLRPTNRKIVQSYKAVVQPRLLMETKPRGAESASGRSRGARKLGTSQSLAEEPLNLRTGYFTPLTHEWRPVLPIARVQNQPSFASSVGDANELGASASVPAGLTSRSHKPQRELSYKDIQVRSNLLGLGTKGREAKAMLRRAGVVQRRQVFWVRVAYTVSFWQTVFRSLKGAVVDRQQQAARTLQKFAGAAGTRREHRSVRMGAAGLLMKFLKRFVSLRFDSEDNWVRRTRPVGEKSHVGLLQQFIQHDHAHQTGDPGESGRQVLQDTKDQQEQQLVPQKPKTKRHVRMFLKLYQRVFILRGAIAKFFQSMLQTKRAQARSMNLLWAKVRKNFLVDLQGQAKSILTDGLAIDKKSQELCGEGTGVNWLWLEDAKMWVDLPKETKSAPVENSNALEALKDESASAPSSVSDSVSGDEAVDMIEKGGQTASPQTASPQTASRPRGSILMRVETKEFSTFAHDQMAPSNQPKFENSEEKVLWKNMVLCSVTELTTLKSAFQQWSTDYMATFFPSMKDYKKHVDNMFQKLGFKQKQDLKERQKECKIARVDQVGVRAANVRAAFLAERKERKKEVENARRKSEAEAARLVAQLNSVEERKHSDWDPADFIVDLCKGSAHLDNANFGRVAVHLTLIAGGFRELPAVEVERHVHRSLSEKMKIESHNMRGQHHESRIKQAKLARQQQLREAKQGKSQLRQSVSIHNLKRSGPQADEATRSTTGAASPNAMEDVRRGSNLRRNSLCVSSPRRFRKESVSTAVETNNYSPFMPFGAKVEEEQEPNPLDFAGTECAMIRYRFFKSAILYKYLHHVRMLQLKLVRVRRSREKRLAVLDGEQQALNKEMTEWEADWYAGLPVMWGEEQKAFTDKKKTDMEYVANLKERQTNSMKAWVKTQKQKIKETTHSQARQAAQRNFAAVSKEKEKADTARVEKYTKDSERSRKKRKKNFWVNLEYSLSDAHKAFDDKLAKKYKEESHLQLEHQSAERSVVEHPVLAVQQKQLFIKEREKLEQVFQKFTERRKRMHKYQKNHLFQFKDEIACQSGISMDEPDEETGSAVGSAVVAKSSRSDSEARDEVARQAAVAHARKKRGLMETMSEEDEDAMHRKMLAEMGRGRRRLSALNLEAIEDAVAGRDSESGMTDDSGGATVHMGVNWMGDMCLFSDPELENRLTHMVRLVSSRHHTRAY
jgi:hypothetical protein